jgi:hypothetical protein
MWSDWLSKVILAALTTLLLATCSTVTQETSDISTVTVANDLLADHSNDSAIDVERSPDVPELPFSDNADPTLCGIPQQWNQTAPAYLSGYYEGNLIQPEVFLYDSHLRRKVVGSALNGTEIQIILSQSNPTLDYYFIKVVGAEQPVEGWVPAPFVTFDPPADTA